MMAVTVDNAFMFSDNVESIPNFVDTAVVIKAYGPLPRAPVKNNSPIFNERQYSPYK